MTTITTPILADNAGLPDSVKQFGAGPLRDLQRWLERIGDISLSRVVTDPWIGTATEQDLLRVCESEDRLVELIDGTLVGKRSGIHESKLALRLAYFLMNFIRPRKLGELAGADRMFRLKNGRIRLPDISFISAETLRQNPEMPSVPRVPFLLAVEVLSATNTRREMQIKLEEYFDSGTRLMWIVDPKTQTIAVFDAVTETPSKLLTLADTLDGGTVLPGFTLPLNQLFTAPI